MHKGLALVESLALCFFAVYLLQLGWSVLSCSWQAKQQSGEYIRRSYDVVHKFDGMRRFDDFSGFPKLSTNTYVDNVLVNIDNDQNFKNARENATLLMLVRNRELEGALKSMRSLEDRFNRQYQYDWTFLNDVPFDNDFIEATTAMASGKTQYGLIPSEEWDRPDWINETVFETSLQLMNEKGVIYGGSKSYRNMCRFNSGYFFRQELLLNYDYYFRVEPDVEYFCDFPYDPFKVMREQRKKYGFVISMYEYEDTIPTLWDAVEEFMEEYPELIDFDTNSFDFITDSGLVGKNTPIIDSNSRYNLCHFWSNFEIADLRFFRSERYIKFFEFLDSKGGFYYERWGDAPVHSIGVALLMRRDEIIHFDELGYYHIPFSTCPSSNLMRIAQRCVCDPDIDENIDVRLNSCLMRWWKNGSGKFFMKHT
ncbi:LAFE_0G05314g1_1 [Lachancea fermentati]|uniref:LAFE_0G05314g1_1 n=1 Tax=Lachancea fermentati TaxID=4955 RepID=A0A1G4MH14_LACFM|nr:LAFE_0G05314g1_1 [Lachancea fermentati]